MPDFSESSRLSSQVGSQNLPVSSNCEPTTYVVYWPTTLEVEGYLYGWKNSDGTICVVGSLQASSIDQAAAHLASATGKLNDIISVCGKLVIIGACKTGVPVQEPEECCNRAAHLGGIARRLYNNNFACDSFPCLFLTYTPPNSRQLRFLSENALQLDIASYARSNYQHPAGPSTQLQRLADNAKLLIRVNKSPLSTGIADTELSVLQLNASFEVQSIISGAREPTRSNLKKNARVIVQPLCSRFIWRLPYLVCTFVLFVLNCRIWKGNALKDLLAICHQFDIRIRQAIASPELFKLSYHQDLTDAGLSRANYISFYNTVWLVANDIIIGSAVLAFFCDNSQYLSSVTITFLKRYSIRSLQEVLLWLNDWPGGLKLNYELGKFFCDAFLWFTAAWERMFVDGILAPALPSLLYFVGLSAALGTTFSIAMLADLVSAVTFHLYIFYVIATGVFSYHTSIMASLFNIFRGKKYNTIRQRTEPTDYRLDQLLLGAILFILAAFLFPTVLAYYLIFAISRLSLIGLQALLEAALVFLNHFPLFAIMLRIKDPQRLPGGLAFEVSCSDPSSVHLKNNPISLSAIFYQYWAIWSSYSKHYSPVYLLGKVVTGAFGISRLRPSLYKFTMLHTEDLPT